jgi:two-component sensor histidine kinase
MAMDRRFRHSYGTAGKLSYAAKHLRVPLVEWNLLAKNAFLGRDETKACTGFGRGVLFWLLAFRSRSSFFSRSFGITNSPERRTMVRKAFFNCPKAPAKMLPESQFCVAREAEHRSNNLLASVQAMVKLSQSGTSEGLKDAIEGRIRALANVHSLFVETRWIGAELSSIATQELAPYCKEAETRVRIDGPQVFLKPDIAQPIALILHELATNAAKYGALSAAEGRIDLKWSHGADGWLILCWTEMGGPEIQTPARQGFGTRVIERMVGQLKGKSRFDCRPEGLVCGIAFGT